MAHNMYRRNFLEASGIIGVWILLYSKSILARTGLNLESRSEDNPLDLKPAYNYSYEELQVFLTWINNTIKESKKNNSYAAIVDKSKYTLSLVKDGELQSQYNIELGLNPIDDKKVEGDGCTPEGRFRICKKKDLSRYHKAIMIDYPNIEDAQRGLSEGLISKEEYKQISYHIKNQLTPPQDTKLGSHIELHGEGSGYKGNGLGKNWTVGCIALSNNAIDELYNILKDNSSITIVRYGTTAFKQNLYRSWSTEKE